VVEKDLKNPAIILLGKVVNHRQSILELHKLYASDLRGLV
jgi:uroporphyrin-III C-methyltransferase